MAPVDLDIGFQGLALIQGSIYNPVILQVLDEPFSRWIHIGGDEVVPEKWWSSEHVKWLRRPMTVMVIPQ